MDKLYLDLGLILTWMDIPEGIGTPGQSWARDLVEALTLAIHFL